jgi:hypothetical protein
MKKLFPSLVALIVFLATVTLIAFIIFGLLGAVANAHAQVTVGSLNEPHTFSALELISNGNRAFRLPQMTTVERDAMEATAVFQAEKNGKALGLQIFNTTNMCIETWNGNVWMRVCAVIDPPIVSATQFLCNGSTIAGLTAIGYNIKWYDSLSSDAVALPESTALVTGKTYYASQTVDGIESERAAVTVTLSAQPSAPTVNTVASQSFCGGSTVADLVVTTGTNIKWYSSPSGVTALDPSTVLSAGKYRATQTVNGCEGPKSAEVTVTIKSTPPPQMGSPQYLCEGKTFNDFILVIDGIKWYSEPEGGVEINKDTEVIEGTYYATKTSDGCESSPRTPIVIQIKQRPSVPTFMAYNLGANPAYDTPKKQMEYMSTATNSRIDANVYGGLYQWGRRDTLYGGYINEQGNYRRYYGTTDGQVSQSSKSGLVDVLPTDNPVDSTFYYRDNGSWTGYSASWYSGTDIDSLWGNGVSMKTPTTPNGVIHGSEQYQSTVWVNPDNNPCPDGYRVPTQDEWERIMYYDCDPTNSYVSCYTQYDGSIACSEMWSEYAGYDENGDDDVGRYYFDSGFTWIPVTCNKNRCDNYPGRCVPDGDWTDYNEILSGYAIYETDVWKAAISDTGVYREWDGTAKDFFDLGFSLHYENAPEPFLFLPSAGQRFSRDGTVERVGDNGKYWSSTIAQGLIYSDSERAILLDFYGRGPCQTRQRDFRLSTSTGYHSYGYSIRCVKE